MPEEVQPVFRNRYPGVKPFTAGESNLFFGRDAAIEGFSRMIFIRQTIVLFGKSGCGKSSLLNAGIIPRLITDERSTYFFIRFNNFSANEQAENISPSEALRARLTQNLEGDHLLLDKIIPKENSFWYMLKTNQQLSGKSSFHLFFDQFEELFTYPKEQIDEFSEQLSQLIYDTIPIQFKQRLSEMETKDEISNELYDFLYDKPKIKVIFSIRSDQLSLLNLLTERHPGILQNCYELNALTKEEALMAITKPAGFPQEDGFSTPSFKFTEDSLQKILKNISNSQDSKIETSTLQIICRYIEDELVAAKRQSVIDAESLGNITDIFQRYYENILARLSFEERQQAQRLIEDELVEGGRRNLLSDIYVETKLKLSKGLLISLEQSTLLRKERDASGRLLYELSHDSLVKPIEKVKFVRHAIEAEAQRRKELAEKRRLDEQLSRLEKLRQQKEFNKKAFDISQSKQIRRFYKEQMKLIFKKENLRQTWTGLLAIGFLLFALVWSVIATYKYVNFSHKLDEQSNQLNIINRQFDNYVDSTSNIKGDTTLNNILKKYKALN